MRFYFPAIKTIHFDSYIQVKKEKSIFHTLSFERNRIANTSYTGVFLSSSITNGARNHRYSVNIKTRVRKIIAIDRTSRLSTSTLVNVSNRLREPFFSPFGKNLQPLSESIRYNRTK